MIKVLDLMLNGDNGILDKGHLLREIGTKYRKRLKEKPIFWDKSVSQIKMDFTLIPQHDERLAFWIIRKEGKLVIQCFVFKYQYSTDWQLILSKEIDIKPFDDGFDVAKAEKDIMAVIENFLDMECKDSPKDDKKEVSIDTALEVEFFSELPRKDDARLKDGQVWRVNQSKDYNFRGYYIWEEASDMWYFERDLD